jgi:hypothetical protein
LFVEHHQYVCPTKADHYIRLRTFQNRNPPTWTLQLTTLSWDCNQLLCHPALQFRMSQIPQQCRLHGIRGQVLLTDLTAGWYQALRLQQVTICLIYSCCLRGDWRWGGNEYLAWNYHIRLVWFDGLACRLCVVFHLVTCYQQRGCATIYSVRNSGQNNAVWTCTTTAEALKFHLLVL